MKTPLQETQHQKRTGMVLAVMLAMCGVGCGPAPEAAPARQAEAPLSVKFVLPRRGDILRYVSLPATVAPNQQATLYSKVAGYLKTIAVDRGDEVGQGQLIAEIEVPELVADVARFKAEQEIAALDYQRAREAQAQAPDLVVQQTLDTFKARSLMADANLRRAETLLGFCRITAPFSGVVTRRAVDPGAFVPAATSGSAAQNAVVVTLMDFRVVRVQVAVPEAEVPLIRNGLPVKVRVDGLPGRVFEGGVTRFSQSLDDASRTMHTEIDLHNPRSELRPGMFATVRIGVEKHANALLVPTEALVIEKAGMFVFTVTDGRAKKLPVKTGFNDGVAVEVLEGLAQDQPVILASKMTLNNDQPVRGVEAK